MCLRYYVYVTMCLRYHVPTLPCVRYHVSRLPCVYVTNYNNNTCVYIYRQLQQHNYWCLCVRISCLGFSYCSTHDAQVLYSFFSHFVSLFLSPHYDTILLFSYAYKYKCPFVQYYIRQNVITCLERPPE